MFDGRYTLWGSEHSLFTRKLQAMLNYLALDYDFKLKTADAGRTRVRGCQAGSRSAFLMRTCYRHLSCNSWRRLRNAAHELRLWWAGVFDPEGLIK